VKTRTSEWAALLLALLALGLTAWISWHVFERMPHLEDEFANLWQAEVMAKGELVQPSPPFAKSFLVPFVVDYQGVRFGKYPPGWPAALSLAIRVGAPWLANSCLAALSVWLTYRLGTRLAGQGVGLLAAFLLLLSPMFLMLSSGLMSHGLSLALAMGFTLSWWDIFSVDGAGGRMPRGLPIAVAGTSLGLLGLTRPLTAAGVFLPFMVHAALRGWRGPAGARKALLAVGLLALAIAVLLPLWQWALTGNPLLNPYRLWWPYDRLGFGPGVGVTEGGHDLEYAWINTRFSLRAGQHDLFGWPYLSWLFIPAGLWSARRKPGAWILFGIAAGLVLVYSAYWIGSWLFGPRYYYEALPGLAVLSAAGISSLAGWGRAAGWGLRWRRPLLASLVLLLVTLNAAFYLPARLGGMRGLYGITRAPMEALRRHHLDRALVIVHARHWWEYARLLLLAEPFGEEPLRIAWSRGHQIDSQLKEAHLGWEVYHLYPDEPTRLYLEPR